MRLPRIKRLSAHRACPDPSRISEQGRCLKSTEDRDAGNAVLPVTLNQKHARADQRDGCRLIVRVDLDASLQAMEAIIALIEVK